MGRSRTSGEKVSLSRSNTCRDWDKLPGTLSILCGILGTHLHVSVLGVTWASLFVPVLEEFRKFLFYEELLHSLFRRHLGRLPCRRVGQSPVPVALSPPPPSQRKEGHATPSRQLIVKLVSVLQKLFKSIIIHLLRIDQKSSLRLTVTS